MAASFLASVLAMYIDRRWCMGAGMVVPGMLCAALAVGMMSVSPAVFAQPNREFYATPTISVEGAYIHEIPVDFSDSLAADTLYQVRAANGIPVSYYRKIRTSVCFDNKCRLLDIIVHWNITGRYLGFELPPGEFLSKAEHEPFTTQEYLRLHKLLADPNSPLAEFSYNEVVPAADNQEIDAVSSPTAKNLVAFVVEGAGFTTYMLWHIVHGATPDTVMRATRRALTPALLSEILKSPDISDRIWALNNRAVLRMRTPEIQAQILSLIQSEEFSLAERAVHAIDTTDLQKGEFQVMLVQTLDGANYALKKRVIEKLGMAGALDSRVSGMLADKLMQVSGDLVSTILDLFSKQGIHDDEICTKVARLLQHDNRYISRQALMFLEQVPVPDNEIVQKLKRYRRDHKPE